VKIVNEPFLGSKILKKKFDKPNSLLASVNKKTDSNTQENPDALLEELGKEIKTSGSNSSLSSSSSGSGSGGSGSGGSGGSGSGGSSSSSVSSQSLEDME